MTPAPNTQLVQDLNPLRVDIAGRLKKNEDQISKLRKQAKDVKAALAHAEADHKVLVQLAKVAGTSARSTRTRSAGSSRRGSGERAKQLLKVVSEGKDVTKKDLVAALDVSEVRVQQLLTQLKKQKLIKSAPQPGSRRTLVWSVTPAGKDQLA